MITGFGDDELGRLLCLVGDITGVDIGHAFLCLKTESGYMANAPDFSFYLLQCLGFEPEQSSAERDQS